MKHGQRPTKRQKLIMSQHNLNPANWLVTKNPPGMLYLEHRYCDVTRVIELKGAVR